MKDWAWKPRFDNKGVEVENRTLNFETEGRIGGSLHISVQKVVLVSPLTTCTSDLDNCLQQQTKHLHCVRQTFGSNLLIHFTTLQ